MIWARSLTPTGVPVYESPEGFRIEGDVRLSHHVGMVFGQQVNEAGREARIVGWKAYGPQGQRIGPGGSLAQAKAACERRAAA